uniref:Ovule protein n=1 Tax=Ascaris lumbricoides TaxID=6252 RepID=A0A0M3IW17_ASCLU
MRFLKNFLKSIGQGFFFVVANMVDMERVLSDDDCSELYDDGDSSSSLSNFSPLIIPLLENGIDSEHCSLSPSISYKRLVSILIY